MGLNKLCCICEWLTLRRCRASQSKPCCQEIISSLLFKQSVPNIMKLLMHHSVLLLPSERVWSLLSKLNDCYGCAFNFGYIRPQLVGPTHSDTFQVLI